MPKAFMNTSEHEFIFAILDPISKSQSQFDSELGLIDAFIRGDPPTTIKLKLIL